MQDINFQLKVIYIYTYLYSSLARKMCIYLCVKYTCIYTISSEEVRTIFICKINPHTILGPSNREVHFSLSLPLSGSLKFLSLSVPGVYLSLYIAQILRSQAMSVLNFKIPICTDSHTYYYALCILVCVIFSLR